MTVTLQIRSMEDGDLTQVIDLWHAAGLTQAHNAPMQDIDFARSSPFSDILIGEFNQELVASVMTGCDGHHGTVYYLSAHPLHQGKGFGRYILQAAEDWLHKQGAWKINILIQEGNEAVQGFYDALGYEVEPRTCMAKRLDK